MTSNRTSETPVSDLAQRVVTSACHYLGSEFRTKLRAAVESLPNEGLWWRPNEGANSIGNLLLHLEGNVRQWIVSGVGRAPDRRNRAHEFAAREGAGATELLAALDATLDDATTVLTALTEEQLLERRTIQGRQLVVVDAVLHVVEHFSYHVGQVVFVAKALTPGAVRFYDDAGGLARPIWQAQRVRSE